VPPQDQTEDAAVLSIGLIGSKSSESRAWEDAVIGLGRAVAGSRDGTVAPLNVNVIFHLSGKYTEPEFEGVRTGRFRRATNHLLVQAAVPASMIADESRDPDATVRELLLLAIAEAETWARTSRLTDSLESLRLLAESV
jgi:hypothetical protein